MQRRRPGRRLGGLSGTVLCEQNRKLPLYAAFCAMSLTSHVSEYISYESTCKVSQARSKKRLALLACDWCVLCGDLKRAARYRVRHKA